MKINIIIAFLALILVGNNLLAQRSKSKKTEEIATFYIDAITLSNDSTPRTNVNTRINNPISNNYYIAINNRNLIVVAQDGYKAELINISGIVIQSKQILNGKTYFNVNTSGVYLIKISSKNNETTLLKTLVI